MKRVFTLITTAALTLSLVGCASDSGSTPAASENTTPAQAEPTQSAEPTAAAAKNIVNVGVTDTLGNALNPLNMDWTFINYYATSLEFLPLVQLDKDYEVNYSIAESITTDDNQTFYVKLREDAVWSDGVPITSSDVNFTFIKMAAPAIANPNFDFSVFAGYGDDGLTPEGATEVEGIEILDDKALNFVVKDHISYNTFINNILNWILIIPEHRLGSLSDEELLTTDFFSHPDVVSGPYAATDFDANHYISYTRNENYFGGTPNIEKLNFRIVDGTEILTGLQSGEIDITLPTSANIPAEDRAAVEALAGFTATYTDPITDQMTFINTSKITDARVRRAIVEGIDREQLVAGLLNGKGEVTDGFIPSGSPFYDSSKEKIPYDPEDAKALLEEAGWDSSTVVTYYVSSSDGDVVKAAQIIKEELAVIGVNIDIHTVDFATLMEVGGSDEVDIFSVQYTVTPNDYYSDEAGLIDIPEASWTGGYTRDEIHDLLIQSQNTPDQEEVGKIYDQIDDYVIEDVPMFSLYFLGNLGVTSNRLKGAEPSIYGVLNNVQNWELTD
ncbi:MAG: hypothetical protein IJ225_01350 [Solobacterium sp.]|nr:hypothetical protein [Solobacterium sp.]